MKSLKEYILNESVSPVNKIYNIFINDPVYQKIMTPEFDDLNQAILKYTKDMTLDDMLIAKLAIISGAMKNDSLYSKLENTIGQSKIEDVLNIEDFENNYCNDKAKEQLRSIIEL